MCVKPDFKRVESHRVSSVSSSHRRRLKLHHADYLAKRKKNVVYSLNRSTEAVQKQYKRNGAVHSYRLLLVHILYRSTTAVQTERCRTFIPAAVCTHFVQVYNRSTERTVPYTHIDYSSSSVTSLSVLPIPSSLPSPFSSCSPGTSTGRANFRDLAASKQTAIAS